jgi:hypothetical protein
MLVRQARAAEYHVRAVEASALAEASILSHVREKHEVAAARWLMLAALNERAAPGCVVGSAAAELPAGTEVLARDREETPCTV